MDSLVDRGVKMLVIACNTASAAVLRDARERYEVPVVEVIQPAVRRVVAATRNRRVGVIGTETTVTSRAYQDRSEEHTSELPSRGHLVCRLLLESKTTVQT